MRHHRTVTQFVGRSAHVRFFAADRREANRLAISLARLICHDHGGRNARTTRPSRSTDGRWSASLQYEGGAESSVFSLNETEPGVWLETSMEVRVKKSDGLRTITFRDKIVGNPLERKPIA
jgi:hypothetical protein